MINLSQFEDKIKKGTIDNCYVFCGLDEEAIKDKIRVLERKILAENFVDLNFVKFDGDNLVNLDSVINACETLPFMSEKKIVLIYRANFLGEKEDGNKKSLYNELNSYLKNIPPTCTLIIYYIFKDKREKPSRKILSLEGKATVVKSDKIYGRELESKVKNIFQSKGKDIGNVELKLFCSLLSGDMGIIENEVEKLCCYAIDRDITKEDIYLLLNKKEDDDIFDLVDLIGDKKVKEAINSLNELMHKGDKANEILFMIERQFKLLYRIKYSLERMMSRDQICSEIKLPPFICEKLINQSKKFTISKLVGALDICLKWEKNLKSSSLDRKTQMELLLIETMTA
ncbi:DNA polymerase III subunit delta [Clostridium sp. MSJ-11]|uniref:DNA polymerase III subunit delta n=1 Tax=Clostridium mobile TaxID=2841512 RepID=A0ABS6EEB6_9CLOT|nr:DNA polymerase III subunit delta [Clostridium mobile]MBU5483539.1 DNA polymerase III subunit delta [Clostridium mobile]